MFANSLSFHIPEIPFSPIDALNRRSAAVGSPRMAMGASNSNYNGHSISVSWNDHRRYYITEYYWAGRQVLARGTFKQCLDAALSEYNRGALGTAISISPREDDSEAIELCRSNSLIREGGEDKREWWTWRHECASDCAKDYASRSRAMIFDWKLMQTVNSRAEYEKALREKHGMVYR